MKEIQKFKYVCERDIDFLFVEEISVNPAFAEFFIGKMTTSKNIKDIESYQSVSNELGESDIVVTFKDEENKKTAILIEDKIDAIFQPDQDKRYQLRGKKGIKEGYWDCFKTCLMASDRYLANSTHKLFDATFSYENILTFFSQGTDLRSKYKGEIIKFAINKSRNPYLAQKDDAVTNFYKGYYDFVSANFPEFILKPPTDKPAEAFWIHFYSQKHLPDNRIIHKLRPHHSVFDIVLDYSADELSKARRKFILPKNASFEKVGKNVVIRIPSSVINQKEPFISQEEKVRDSFEKLSNVLSNIKRKYRNIKHK